MDTIRAARSFAIGRLPAARHEAAGLSLTQLSRVAVRGGAKRVMPEVAQALNESNLGGDRSMLGLFTNKDDAARAEELTKDVRTEKS